MNWIYWQALISTYQLDILSDALFEIGLWSGFIVQGHWAGHAEGDLLSL